jgi:hypothetical protein
LQGKLYLASVLDTRSRRIVGFAMESITTPNWPTPAGPSEQPRFIRWHGEWNYMIHPTATNPEQDHPIRDLDSS